MNAYVLPLSDPQAGLENVGGKGLSLARMLRAGFPVPNGFHITTAAYRAFVDANDLQTQILAALKDADPSRPATLEAASATIHALFTGSQTPGDISAAIADAYLNLEAPEMEPVAVRSSATAEDLPEASFAGQQETFLNVRGEADLLDAVKQCWASLWTARAIAYRIKNRIDQNTVALAVVVQEMVDAEAAGILFTANPINGRRDEMVINAAWGLGEAIVGGLVSPDMIVADKASGRVKQYEVAEKTVITVRTDKGTREEKLEDGRSRSKALSEADVAELVAIARQIESYYGRPQDIEWCHAGGRFYIVQSRPVTALPETPIEWKPPDPKGIYMRASVVDLMPGPLSPLFITLAIPALRDQIKPLSASLGMGEPNLQQDYYTAINSYAYMNAAFPAKAWWWILTELIPMFVKTFGKLGIFWREQMYPEYLAFVAGRRDQAPEQMSLAELWHQAQEFVNASARYVCGLLFATMGAAAGAELLATNAYNKLAKREGDPDASALLMGWDNIPVRAGKSLYDLALWVRARAGLAEYVLATPADQIVEQLKDGRTPTAVAAEDWKEMRERFSEHLQAFGHIIFQLDFAEPLPLDNPAPMLENVKMYLRGQGVDPYARQKASEEKRIQTGETALRRLKGLKRWAFKKALDYGQSMAAVREDALAEIGLGYPMLRRILHELGSRLAKAGVIERPHDIFLLEKNEIEALVHGAQLELAGLVAERKAYRERLGKETPPPMMPMKKKYMGIDTSVWLAESERNRNSNMLKGAPTSAGKVTAPACVLLGPDDFHRMRSGDVLVAGTTTPAWTPLFAMASAVVTDIGGPLSHGSIVAREYGIPAVMGTGVATKRIQSGQVITVDGTKGEVLLTASETRPEQAMPPTEWKLPRGAYAVMRNNIVELMADPLSPLFTTLGLEAINTSLPRMMNESFGMRGIMPPELIIVVNHYAYNNGSVSAKGMVRLMFNMGKIARMMFTGAVERWTDNGRPLYIRTVENWQAKNWQAFSSVELVHSARQLTESAIDAYGALVSGVIPAAWISEAVFTNVYDRLIKRRADPSAPTYLLGYDSLPIRADKSLYSLAEWARGYPALAQCLERTSTAQLAAWCESEMVPGDLTPALWQEWRAHFHQHLRDYGYMLYDLDFVHPVPADDPAPVLDALKLYLRAQGTNPYTRQRESSERREQAVIMMRQRLKGLRLKWFNKYLASAQKYAPLREDGLAEIGRAYPLIRQMLRELGDRFARQHVIPAAEEIYWLTQDEVLLTATRLDARQPAESLAEQIPLRKAEHRAALSVRPPMMLPQLKFFGFDLMSLKDKRGRRNRGDVIKGVAASPGTASGVGRVLHGPEDFSQMKPGDVLIAPITTPAWTPLFAMAAAIVTDVGGPLSHGSIVAREYGIPAVLGTGVATRRIHSGDVVEVNGTEGKVTIRTRGTAMGAQWIPPHPKGLYVRGSLCEHLPNPVSPLFATLGIRMVNIPTREIGEMALGVGGGGYQYHAINGYVFLGMVLTWREWVAMARNSGTLARSMFKVSHEHWQAGRTELAAAIAAQDAKDLTSLAPTALLDSARELMTAIGKFYTVIQASTLPSASSSEIMFTRAYKLASRRDDPKAERLLFGQETTPLRAEKALFDLGQWTRERSALCDFMLHSPTGQVAAALRTDPAPDTVPAADWSEFKRRFRDYLDEFGHTTYEFDFMNPTPAETPEVILDALRLYIEGRGSDPYARQSEAIRLREETLQKIRTRSKLIPNRWFDRAINWAMRVGPDREDSIADLGMGHTTLRAILGELGKRFVEHGAVRNAEDIYWLLEDEVGDLASRLEHGQTLPSCSARVAERKALWQAQKKLLPPNTLPENSIWGKMLPWNRANTTGNVLTGLASSAGEVTGRARVLFGPEDFGRMSRGDVLVAVTTTPAWTPLFALASAIVTDLGGPLSHSSIVAREYGIPAVVATGVGTRRIKDGETITVNGSTGTVTLHTE